MSDFELFPIITDKVVEKPEYVNEILCVIGMIEAARHKAQTIAAPLPPAFAGLDKTGAYIRPWNISRVQNPRLSNMFGAAMKEVAVINGKRASPARTLQGVAFHGTDIKSAETISEHGPNTHMTRHGDYGWGFYVALLNYLIPKVYAERRASNVGGLPTLLLGDCIVGHNSATRTGLTGPNPGSDTGGCGSEWILTVFDNYHFNPRYVIEFKPCTKDEWDGFAAEFRAPVAAAVPIPVAPPAAVQLPAVAVPAAPVVLPAAAAVPAAVAVPAVGPLAAAAVLAAPAAAVPPAAPRKRKHKGLRFTDKKKR
jgi:hypothetical protein